MKTPDLPKAEFIRLDLFPAVVHGDAITGSVIDKVRVVITDAHVHVLRLSSIGDVELVYSFDLDAVGFVDGRRERGYTVVTGEDGNLTVKRSPGCGCGMQRLKSAKLYPYPVGLVSITV